MNKSMIEENGHIILYKNLQDTVIPAIDTDKHIQIIKCRNVKFSTIKTTNSFSMEACRGIRMEELFVDDEFRLANCRKINFGQNMRCLGEGNGFYGCSDIYLAHTTIFTNRLSVQHLETGNPDRPIWPGPVHLPQNYLFAPELSLAFHGVCPQGVFGQHINTGYFDADATQLEKHFTRIHFKDNACFENMPPNPLDLRRYSLEEGQMIFLGDKAYKDIKELNNDIKKYHKDAASQEYPF